MRLTACLGVPFLAAALIAREAVGAPIECPKSIIEAPSDPELHGWVLVSPPAEKHLEYVGVYVGPPAWNDAHVPAATHRTDLREIVTWRIARTPNTVFWIGCSYFGTASRFFRLLEPTVERCIATYELLPSGTRLGLKALDCE